MEDDLVEAVGCFALHLQSNVYSCCATADAVCIETAYFVFSHLKHLQTPRNSLLLHGGEEKHSWMATSDNTMDVCNCLHFGLDFCLRSLFTLLSWMYVYVDYLRGLEIRYFEYVGILFRLSTICRHCHLMNRFNQLELKTFSMDITMICSLTHFKDEASINVFMYSTVPFMQGKYGQSTWQTCCEPWFDY